MACSAWNMHKLFCMSTGDPRGGLANTHLWCSNLHVDTCTAENVTSHMTAPPLPLLTFFPAHTCRHRRVCRGTAQQVGGGGGHSWVPFRCGTAQ